MAEPPAAKRRFKLARAKCPECGREGAVSIPQHATDDVYRWHRKTDGGLCPHSRMPVDAGEYVSDPMGVR